MFIHMSIDATTYILLPAPQLVSHHQRHDHSINTTTTTPTTTAATTTATATTATGRSLWQTHREKRLCQL